MKKVAVSMMLMLVMVVTMGLPVFAIDANDEVDTSQMKPLQLVTGDEVTNVELNPLSSDEMNRVVFDVATDSPSNVASSADVADAMAIESEDTDNVSNMAREVADRGVIREIHTYPIVYCVEDELFYPIYSIERYATFYDVGQQGMMLSLKESDVDAMFNRAGILIGSDPSLAGKTFKIAGLTVQDKFQVIAQKPLYIKWTPTATCMQGTAEKKIDVPGTNVNLDWTVREHFFFPEPNSDGYYYVGINAAFYRYYPNGTVGGIAMNGGVGVSR